MNDFLWNSPVEISGIKLKNRIVFPPLSGNFAEENGNINQKILNFYKNIAEGGCGMIVVEGTAISVDGKGASNSMCLYNSEHMVGLKSLVKLIKENYCTPSIQLMHAGGQANTNFTGYEPIAPSLYKCNPTGFTAREMSINEIINVRKNFIKSARLAKEAGFDAVEVHLAHGYLLHEFLSEHFNKRKDKYGGNLENRTRFVLDIIDGIKRNSNLVIGVRISGEDYVEGGINYKENKKIIPLLEEAGIEYFSVTAGIYETSKFKHEAMKRGEFFDYSRKIKSITNKPVIGVGKILDLETAENHLKNQDCDMVAIGRGQIADPQMIKKYLWGIPNNKCSECGGCQYLKFGKKDLECPIGGI